MEPSFSSPRWTEAADAELVDASRAGDLDAFGVLIRRHHGRVAGLCRSLLNDAADADDAAQDVFLKAHRALAKFKGEASFLTWVYRIAMNPCLDLKRRGGGARTVSLDGMLESGGDAAESRLQPPRPRADVSRETELAEGYLAGLPESYRDALSLRANGLRYREIAQALGTSVDSIKAKLRRARRGLADILRHQKPPEAVQTRLGTGESA